MIELVIYIVSLIVCAIMLGGEAIEYYRMDMEELARLKVLEEDYGHILDYHPKLTYLTVIGMVVVTLLPFINLVVAVAYVLDRLIFPIFDRISKKLDRPVVKGPEKKPDGNS